MTIQEICVNIDRSGSMRGKESDTVGGINAMLDSLKSSKTDEDTIRVSIKLFDHEQVMKTRRVDISEIEEFPLSEFVPRGQTALLDAIGDSLRFFMEKKLRDPTAYDTCLLYVATDGLENASARHSRNDVKKLIENAESTYNIKVIYLGANQDAILEATNIGISSTSAINYSETQENVQAVYRSAAAVAYRDRSFPQITPSFTQVERQASVQSPQIPQLVSPGPNAISNDIPMLTRQHNVDQNNVSFLMRPPSIVRQPSLVRPPSLIQSPPPV